MIPQLLLSLLLVLSLLTAPVSAAQGEQTSTGAVTAPVDSLNALLAEDSRQARLWWYGWLGAFSALTVGQGAIYALAKDEGFRQDNLVGAVGSTLGIAGLLIHPVKPYDYPDASKSDSELLADRSRREDEGRGWLNHVLGAAVPIGSGAVLWYHYKRPAGSVALNVGAGLLIGELQIWSQPTLARDQHSLLSGLNVIAGPGSLALQSRF